MPASYSVLASWALLVLRTLQADGHDVSAVLARAGIPLATLGDPNARISARAMGRLWRYAAEESNDPCFGLHAAQHWHPSTMHGLGYAWLASPTLLEALQRLARYARVLNTAAAVVVAELPGRVRVVGGTPDSPGGEAPPTVASDAVVATVVQMCRSSLGEDFAPDAVYLRRAMPASAGRYAQFFRTEVYYGSSFDGLDIGIEYATCELPTGNAQLAIANDQVVADYLARIDRGDVVARARNLLVRSLPSGLTSITDIANGLAMSPRSLQRRLREQGTSFNDLLDGVRRELALAYLSDRQRSVTEVAFLLGFSEASNFSRAFKRWTGHRPGEHRPAP